MEQLVVFRGGKSDPRRSANRLSTAVGRLEHRPVVVVVLMYSLKFSSTVIIITSLSPQFLKIEILEHTFHPSFIRIHDESRQPRGQFIVRELCETRGATPLVVGTTVLCTPVSNTLIEHLALNARGVQRDR